LSDPVRVTRGIEFSSSLRLWRKDLGEAENRRLYGPRAERHGHNYRLEVSLRGEPDARTGMLVDLKDVKAVLEREVMARFDHRDLNCDTDCFEKVPPTTEQLALVIFRILDGAFPPRLLERVRVYEGPDLWVDVEREGGA
jgi:6-pyruvoyltetrahydropterin/6-carboxytetrahydropterin synthase